jgi:hypothetical protein
MPNSDRILIAKIAAHARWARETDRAEATLKARQAFADRFEREVDPEGVLPYGERQKRADNARRAYFHALARKSAKARAK